MSQIVFVLLVLISGNYQAISRATFENISVILKWRSGMRDHKMVIVHSDNYLRRHVGDFGEIIIRNQNIPKLGEGAISDLVKMTHLHLTESGLRKIERRAFRNLPALTDLNLSGNLLETIDDGIFDNLTFKTLYLENNKIGRIGERAFNNLKMEYLFIDDNKISRWDSDWFSGTPLTSVSMRNNLVKSVNKLSFEYLWHFSGDVILENFILSGNELEYIDLEVFEGVKIIYFLSLKNNSLKYLEPGLFNSVEAIDMLDLSDNLISELYYQTFWKTSISVLNVYNNLIQCISTDIFNVSSLTKLNVGENPISCDCVQEWQKWEGICEIEITNFGHLEENCKKSIATKKCLDLILFSLILFIFGTSQ